MLSNSQRIRHCDVRTHATISITRDHQLLTHTHHMGLMGETQVLPTWFPLSARPRSRSKTRAASSRISSGAISLLPWDAHAVTSRKAELDRSTTSPVFPPRGLSHESTRPDPLSQMLFIVRVIIPQPRESRLHQQRHAHYSQLPVLPCIVSHACQLGLIQEPGIIHRTRLDLPSAQVSYPSRDRTRFHQTH